MARPEFNPFRAALPHLMAPSAIRAEEQKPTAWINICSALGALTKGAGSTKRRKIAAAVLHIEDSLYPECSAAQWVLSKNKSAKDLKLTNDWPLWRDNMQAWRYRWLTHLADQYDRKEILQ